MILEQKSFSDIKIYVKFTLVVFTDNIFSYIYIYIYIKLDLYFIFTKIIYDI